MPTIEAEAVDGLILADGMEAVPQLTEDFEWGSDGTDISVSGGGKAWTAYPSNAGTVHEIDTDDCRSGTRSFHLGADAGAYGWWQTPLTWGSQVKIQFSIKREAGVGTGYSCFFWHHGTYTTIAIWLTDATISTSGASRVVTAGLWHDVVIDHIDYVNKTFRMQVDGTLLSASCTFSFSSGADNMLNFCQYNGCHAWLDDLVVTPETLVILSPAASDGLKLSAGSTRLFESYLTTYGPPAYVYAGYGAAQTFTPTISHVITSVKLRMYRLGSIGTVTAAIRATSAGKPTGADLCSGTTDGDTVPTGSYENREIQLGAGATLAAGEVYAITLIASSGDGVGNRLYWGGTGSGAYSGGTFLYGQESTWTIYAGADVFFEEYGHIPSLDSLVDTYPALTDGSVHGDSDASLVNPMPAALDGLTLAEDLAAALSLSPAAADGLVLSEDLTPGIVLALALEEGMTLADAVALAVSLSPLAADGFTWLDELNKIYLWLEEGVDLGDSTRVRLPYLYKPGRKKEAYSLGRLHDQYNLGSSQKGYGIGG